MAGFLRRFREWGSRRLLARVYHICHRMPAQLRMVQPAKILIVAPHIDDEVIGPGGTVALHQSVGSTIGVVYVSNSAGDQEQTGVASQTDTRKGEAQACARELGFTILDFLDFPDGQLFRHENPMATRLAAILKSWQPEHIFCPFPTDHHRDHQAVASALALALRRADWKGEIWGFEVWSTIWPNVIVDISSVIERKRAGIACHVSQLQGMSYLDASLGLNCYRGLRVGVAAGEAFYVCPAQEFCQLTSQLLYQV